MAGFVDVLLRGLILALASVALGGVAWLGFVLRAEAHVKPAGPTTLALRAVAVAAAGVAAAQAAVVLVSLAALATEHGVWLTREFFATTFALTATARVAWALGLAALAWSMARRAAGRGAWAALGVGATALVASSAVLSHAVARVEWRGVLLALDAAHQVAVALWVGGLAHLTLYAAWRQRNAALLATLPDPAAAAAGPLVRRFSALAFRSMAAIILAGVALTWVYVGDAAAFVGTAYGVMIVSKVLLLAAALGLAYANMRAVRRAAREPGVRLFRFVEVELGLGITILFAAASLTSLPPAVDVTVDRATVAEVAARFEPAPPRLTSPPIDELLRVADPLMGRQVERKQVERAWSEYNHHSAGMFVLVMGLLAVLEGAGVRAARHWPLVFLGLAAFLAVRNDPRAWPLGPAGFWESLVLPDVLQHRAFVVLVVAFGILEWMVRTGRLAERPWAYVFPLLCAAGGGLLLTHSHAMFNLKEEFLTEVTHAPLGILGAFLGWGRWLELRVPEAGRWPAWTWRGCLTAVGLFLIFYREG
jgi:putative copper resistance protein D